MFFDTRENPKGIEDFLQLKCTENLSSLYIKKIMLCKCVLFILLGLGEVCPNQDKSLIVFPAKKCGAIEISVCHHLNIS